MRGVARPRTILCVSVHPLSVGGVLVAVLLRTATGRRREPHPPAERADSDRPADADGETDSDQAADTDEAAADRS